MFNLPQKTILGELRIIHTFQFFDIPRLFVCKNQSGTQYLVVSTFDDNELFEWLYLALSNDRLATIVNKGMSLLDAFILPEDGFLLQVSADFEGKSEVKHIFPEQVDAEDLPEKDVFLHIDNNTFFDNMPIEVDAKISAISSRRETYNFHLYPWDTQLPELELRGLGGLLISFQDLVDAIGQSCNGEATLKGAIPHHILSKTKFKAAHIFKGSFGIQFKSDSINDIFWDSLASDTLLELTNLLKIGDNEDNISNKLHLLQGRVASKYRSFLRELTRLNTPVKFDWGSPNIERGYELYFTKEILKNVYSIVSKIEVNMSDEITFQAELLGLDTKTKKYRVRHLDENEDYFGKISEESLNQVARSEINGIYEVTLKKIIETNSSSGVEYIKWLLVGLR